jgi:hypothetical protein
MSVVLVEQVLLGSAFKSATARLDKGTRCSLRPLIRSGGTVQIFWSISISERRSLITSLVRAAVRIRNSSAFASRLSRLANDATKLG